MASEGMPVSSEVIAWARKRAGLTQEEAAKKFTKIAAWEDGTSQPSYPQLERMAEEFRIPVAVFFFPEPPALPPIRESFRTLPDTEFDRLPRQIRFLLRKAKAFQLNLAELTAGQNPAPRLITRQLRFPVNVAISEMAARVSEYLGIGLADQERWPDDDSALKVWRSALNGVGLFVFKDAFRVEGYSGFSLYDDEFPIIYVNNSSTKTRQIFTLFHELAHLLFQTSGIDPDDSGLLARLPAQQRGIEVICNQFAGEFLVPEARFRAVMAGRDPSETTAQQLAQQFHVSREVIYRKFLDRGWIDQAEYTRAAAQWSGQRKSEGGGGGDWYRTQISYLGRGYIELALQQYHRNRIDEVQLADYLNTSPRNVGTLEEYFSKGSQ
jgi:Zn-dependent peptidase ImmA (M78 family)